MIEIIIGVDAIDHLDLIQRCFFSWGETILLWFVADELFTLDTLVNLTFNLGDLTLHQHHRGIVVVCIAGMTGRETIFQHRHT